MDGANVDPAAAAALEAERRFVLSLGGYALEIAGATLVTHEKVPVPRFNFVEEHGVGAERQTAFFERALDHYFQRALRPTFRIPEPVPGHLDAGLRRFGFSPRPSRLVLLLSTGERPETLGPTVDVRPATPGELDRVAAFWASERERPELRSALHVVMSHPNPHERLAALLARIEEEPVAGALVYRCRDAAGIHAVATRPEARGQGAASAIVRYALEHDPVGPGARYSIFADSPRLERRLGRLGFRPALSFREYDLPAGAELSIPPAGPRTPPRWRPPRSGGGHRG